MDDELRAKLEALKFQPHGDVGAMRAGMEDVDFVAIEHPLKGVALIVTYVGPRSASHFEMFLPPAATIQQIAALMVEAFERVHPERRLGPDHAPR